MRPELSDDELMASLASGDQTALRILVQRWERPVLAFLTRMLGSGDDARDIGSESFWRVYQNAGSYRARGRFKSWLFRIAGNLARSQLRRRKVLMFVGLQSLHGASGKEVEPVASGPLSDEAMIAEETRREVQEALSRLPPRQRQAVLLRQYEELSYREIAFALGTSVSAVETLLFRAMRGLRRELQGRTSKERRLQ